MRLVLPKKPFLIVIMNLVFSFDSILAAIPLTKDLEARASLDYGGWDCCLGNPYDCACGYRIGISQKNRMYEVLACLFYLGRSHAGHRSRIIWPI